MRSNSSEIFLKALVVVIHFLSFKGAEHAYLLKKSKTHNTKPIRLLSLLINCISAISEPKYCLSKMSARFAFQIF